MAEPVIRLGELRWLLWIMTREQVAQVGGTGITETPANIGQVHAKIEALRPVTFYQARQTDMPVTHMLWTRWLDYLDNTHAFVRQTRRPIDSAIRTEVFRVRRVLEIGGRKRFSMIECELEDAGWTAAASPIPGGSLPAIDSNGNPANTTPYATEVASALPVT